MITDRDCYWYVLRVESSGALFIFWTRSCFNDPEWTPEWAGVGSVGLGLGLGLGCIENGESIVEFTYLRNGYYMKYNR